MTTLSTTMATTTATTITKDPSLRLCELSPPPPTPSSTTPTGTNRGSIAFDEKGILFGRGKSIQERPPNIHFRKFVSVFRENYQSTTIPSERHHIVQRIVAILQQDGYSFLKPAVTGFSDSEGWVHDHGSWVPASPPEVHKKVTSLFRTPRPAAAAAVASSPSSATTTISNAQTLLLQHHAAHQQPIHRRSVLPPGGILWSEGTQSIRLVEGADGGPIPISSYSLFPTAVRKTFGANTGIGNGNGNGNGDDSDDDDDDDDDNNDDTEDGDTNDASAMATPPLNVNAGSDGGIDGSPMPSIDTRNHKTIGYTQQTVGNLTILRPIVLLRDCTK